MYPVLSFARSSLQSFLQPFPDTTGGQELSHELACVVHLFLRHERLESSQVPFTRLSERWDWQLGQSILMSQRVVTDLHDYHWPCQVRRNRPCLSTKEKKHTKITNESNHKFKHWKALKTERLVKRTALILQKCIKIEMSFSSFHLVCLFLRRFL